MKRLKKNIHTDMAVFTSRAAMYFTPPRDGEDRSVQPDVSQIKRLAIARARAQSPMFPSRDDGGPLSWYLRAWIEIRSPAGTSGGLVERRVASRLYHAPVSCTLCLEPR